MSIRTEQLKRNSQNKLYRQEIKLFKEELKTIPWYTMDKENRKYRAELKEAIRGIEKLLNN